jgi:hypothetical protein
VTSLSAFQSESFLSDCECNTAYRWAGLKAIGKVVRMRETAGKTTKETAYYLLSSELKPERFSEVAREHWEWKTASTGGWMW